MEKLEIYNPENNITYVLELPADMIKRAKSDVIYMQTLLNEQLQLHQGVDQCGKQTDKVEKDIWTKNETTALIESYKSRQEEFHIVKKRKFVWDNISNDLLALDISKTPKCCEIKWKNLVRTYKSVKDNTKKSGRETNRFGFFEIMDDVLGDKPSASCSHTYESSCIPNKEPEKNNDEDKNSETGESSTTSNSEEPVPGPSRTPKRKRATASTQQEEYFQLKKEALQQDFLYKEQKNKILENHKKKKEELLLKYLEIEERKVLALEKYFDSLK